MGVACTPFGKWPERSFKALTREVFLDVLGDAGLSSGAAIEAAWFGNCGMALWGQPNIRGQVCFVPLVREGLFPERVPLINVEGGCATGSLAFHGACKDILSGECELSLAMGVEKMVFAGAPDKTLALFTGAIDQLDPDEWREHYTQAGDACGLPYAPEPGRVLFLDTYAMQASHHMLHYGTTRRQMAVCASKSHRFGVYNPRAQYRMNLSVKQVLLDKPILGPLTRSMCAPVSDGAAAALLCSGAALKKLPDGAKKRAVRVRASALAGGKYRRLDEPSLTRVAADKAYAQSGVGPSDIHVAEVHDATSFCEIYQAEMLRFCAIGDGGPFVESGATRLRGQIPTNTSGGLVSKGHPVAATGLSMVYELCTQLRGEAGPRQVAGARLGLAQNGGGQIGFEEAACSVLILEKG